MASYSNWALMSDGSIQRAKETLWWHGPAGGTYLQPATAGTGLYEDLIPQLSASEDELLQYLANTFEEGQLNDIFENYTTSDKLHLDIDWLKADLDQILEALANEPTAPRFDEYLNDARAQIGSENSELYADLDRLLDKRTELYDSEMASLSDSYNSARSNLLSQQYAQNSQLMDTLQSGMERSRRNALEAGASAGIRIADNINTLLSVQNKQSNASMETANQLAQMMVSQRNAENAARSSYTDALAKDTSDRHAIRLGSEDRAASLANTNYNSAYSAYSNKRQDWESDAASNPLYDYMPQIKKSKYSKYSGGTTSGN